MQLKIQTSSSSPLLYPSCTILWQCWVEWEVIQTWPLLKFPWRHFRFESVEEISSLPGWALPAGKEQLVQAKTLVFPFFLLFISSCWSRTAFFHNSNISVQRSFGANYHLLGWVTIVNDVLHATQFTWERRFLRKVILIPSAVWFLSSNNRGEKGERL